jgi:5-methylcytosine-specific restriction endonuclease McrA
VQNIFVDHIKPIIDPDVGFTTWDECIERMFCEADNLQVLCKSCHEIKSNEERASAVLRRANKKEETDDELF